MFKNLLFNKNTSYKITHLCTNKEKLLLTLQVKVNHKHTLMNLLVSIVLIKTHVNFTFK